MTRDEKIYNRLLMLFPNLGVKAAGGYRKVVCKPCVPLNIDIEDQAKEIVYEEK